MHALIHACFMNCKIYFEKMFSEADSLKMLYMEIWCYKVVFLKCVKHNYMLHCTTCRHLLFNRELEKLFSAIRLSTHPHR